MVVLWLFPDGGYPRSFHNACFGYPNAILDWRICPNLINPYYVPDFLGRARSTARRAPGEHTRAPQRKPCGVCDQCLFQFQCMICQPCVLPWSQKCVLRACPFMTFYPSAYRVQVPASKVPVARYTDLTPHQQKRALEARPMDSVGRSIPDVLPLGFDVPAALTAELGHLAPDPTQEALAAAYALIGVPSALMGTKLLLAPPACQSLMAR